MVLVGRGTVGSIAVAALARVAGRVKNGDAQTYTDRSGGLFARLRARPSARSPKMNRDSIDMCKPALHR